MNPSDAYKAGKALYTTLTSRGGKQPTPASESVQLQHVVLVALENEITVKAQYNPQEIQIEKSVSWTAAANAKDDRPNLEFGSVAARTLSMELMFDTYESGLDVQEAHVSDLMKLMAVMDPGGNDEMRKRPSLVQVQWGQRDMPIFEGVVESVAVKYTMFLPSGRPVRATCNVKVKETGRAFKADRKKFPGRGASAW